MTYLQENCSTITRQMTQTERQKVKIFRVHASLEVITHPRNSSGKNTASGKAYLWSSDSLSALSRL